jgi:adenylate kinase
MNLVLLGPPGCGKGTQAERLVKHYHLLHLSTGDMLRAEVAAGSALGQEVDSIMHAGRLVPDSLIIGIIDARMNKPDALAGFVLDGFPRTVPQAIALEAMLRNRKTNLDHVLNIDVPDENVVQRITGRFSCAKCGALYNDYFHRPKVENVCDSCGGTEFLRRKDDTDAVVRERLKAYHSQTAPIIAHYRDKGVMRTVDGRGDIDQVSREIMAAVGPETCG